MGSISSETNGRRTERSSDEIQRDIRKTRAQMERTIGELGRRMNPRAIADDLKHSFQSEEGAGRKIVEASRRFGDRVVDVMQERPVLSGAAAVTAAWLLLRNRDEGRESGGGARGRQVRERLAGARARLEESASETRERITGKTHGMTERLSQKTHGITERLRNAASGGISKLKHSKHEESRMGEQGTNKTKATLERVRRQSESHPLGVSFASLALGFLAGALIPSSRAEERNLGEYAHRMKDAVKDYGHELQEASQEAMSAASQTVRERMQGERERESRGGEYSPPIR